ncbi:MAG: glycosyltransferase family 2 protein [Bacteroidetes bacterium]|nr:glycosyltransferase family 2 protein [Bacteroidota bacterium]
MRQPILSVIVPVFNTENYLDKCLDSIANQTLTDIEIIVVNDCSPGDTGAVMERFLNDDRISYIKLSKNGGLGTARNEGMRKASGKYITFCDSDDWVDLYLYEEMCSSLERSQAEIAICGIVKEFEYEAESVVKCHYDKEIELDNITAFRIMTFQYSYGITITPSASNKVINREFLVRNKVAFLENTYYEDLHYSFQIMLLANKVVCIPKHHYHYFRRTNSIVISVSKKHIENFYFVFNCIRKWLQDVELYEVHKYNYYKFGERFYNLIIRQIFEFEKDVVVQKELLSYSFQLVKRLVVLSEFIEFTSAEKLRRHLQPFIKDTTII